MKSQLTLLLMVALTGLQLADPKAVNAQTMDIWGKGEVPRITDPKEVPQTLPELWKGYNQSYDKDNPLDAKIHKIWETKDGIVVNWVQLTVGTFQGKKSIVCGYWAYPKV